VSGRSQVRLPGYPGHSSHHESLIPGTSESLQPICRAGQRTCVNRINLSLPLSLPLSLALALALADLREPDAGRAQQRRLRRRRLRCAPAAAAAAAASAVAIAALGSAFTSPQGGSTADHSHRNSLLWPLRTKLKSLSLGGDDIADFWLRCTR
jgi:hypothetical protein